MKSVKVARQIPAPVERVFAVFTDLEHAAGRVSNIKKVEVLTPGGFGLGTRWLETRAVLGQLDTAEMEVTSFEANRAYTITHHKAGARIDTLFTFEPAGAFSNVSIEFRLDSHGLPPGLLAPVGWALGGKVEEALEHDLTDLAAAVVGSS